MKVLILFTILLSFHSYASDLKCEARHEYIENDRLISEKWEMSPKTKLSRTFEYDGTKAYYSINLDSNDGRYLIAINFAPDYTRGSLSSGKLEEGGNNLTLSVVDGYDVHKIICLRN